MWYDILHQFKGMTMKKININVNEEIYNSFKIICRNEDTSAAVELRLYMKRVVEKNDNDYREKHNITIPKVEIRP